MSNRPKTPVRKSYRELDSEELSVALSENSKKINELFDIPFMKSLTTEIVELLNMYFRPEFIGFDEMEERNNPERPIIYACNHSGMAFPWDAIMFGCGVYNMHNYEMKKLFRPLAAPMLSASVLMNPFLLKDVWKRVGAVDATSLNFETLMQSQDSNILIYPEGVPGIGKGFNRKYELQTFSTSMIRMAIKYKTDIVGLACINGEYINPYSYTSNTLNRLVNKLGIPFFPIAFHTPLMLIQPWLFYYAWPAKLTYVKGNRYSPYEMAGNKNLEDLSQDEIKKVRNAIQEDMQLELSKAVSVYGEKPFNWRELWANMKKYWQRLPYWTPIGWPALFAEYDRRYYKDKELPTKITSGLFKFWYIIFKNPIVLAYFIPILGWIPILWRGLRGRQTVKPWEGSKV